MRDTATAMQLSKPYRQARFLVHNIMTIYMVMYASAIAQSWTIWFVLCAFGLIADVMRRKFNPELHETPQQLWARLEKVKRENNLLPTLNFIKRPLAAFFWSVSIYICVIIGLHWSYGPEFLQPWFNFCKPFTEAMYSFSYFHEKQEQGLIRFGYSHVVPIMHHVFAVTQAGYTGWLILLLCFARMKTFKHTNLMKEHIETVNKIRIKLNFILLFLFIFIFGIFLHKIGGSNVCSPSSQMSICASEFLYFFGILILGAGIPGIIALFGISYYFNLMIVKR